MSYNAEYQSGLEVNDKGLTVALSLSAKSCRDLFDTQHSFVLVSSANYITVSVDLLLIVFTSLSLPFIL